MSDVLKQTMEKRKRFTVVGYAVNADPFSDGKLVNHVLATDAETAKAIAAASVRQTYPECQYEFLTVFAGFQTPVL